MIKRLLLITALGVTLSGCFMAPLAFVGPAASGFSTTSLLQSGVTSGVNYVVKKSTGKSMAEHAMESLGNETLQQSYAPKDASYNVWKKTTSSYNKISERCKKFDFYCKRKLNKSPELANKLLPNSEHRVGCKKYDFYCKRMSKKIWLQHINQNTSLLGSS